MASNVYWLFFHTLGVGNSARGSRDKPIIAWRWAGNGHPGDL
jgi:hypothetical protein